MKKSKIILPAIALLAVSGIASVTGTVAWFTAASTANVTLSNVTALSTDANLTLTLNTDTSTYWGCTLNGQAVTGDNLTDVSYTPGASTPCYKALMASEADTSQTTTGTVESFYTVTENATTNAKDGTKVYYTLRFEATISSSAITSSSTEQLDVFMNLSDLANYAFTGTSTIKNAARLGVESESNTFVWAPTTTDSKVQHVTGTEKTAISDYTISTEASTSVHAVKGNLAKAGTTSRATSKKNGGYIGTLSASATTIKVKFTVWFEGTDSSCVNAYAGGTIGGAFNFYAISSSQYAGA